MSKYEKMVSLNRESSKEKVSLAIAAIIEMQRAGEKVMICELTKRTGLSRGFFYKNPKVRKELDTATELQGGKSFTNPRKAILDKAMEKQVGLLEKQNERLKEELEELGRENKKLKKTLNKKELDFIKRL